MTMPPLTVTDKRDPYVIPLPHFLCFARTTHDRRPEKIPLVPRMSVVRAQLISVRRSDARHAMGHGAQTTPAARFAPASKQRHARDDALAAGAPDTA
jgi:hypothetical protein